MAKKKYDPNDPDTWSDSQMNKYIIEKVQEISSNLPWESIVLSGIFTYGHWKAYGAGPLPTKGDVMLGVVYALTIPPALKGGTVANTYAVGALGVLAAGLAIQPSMIEEIKDSIIDAGEEAANAPENFVDSVSNVADIVKSWYDSLPSLTPPSP